MRSLVLVAATAAAAALACNAQAQTQAHQMQYQAVRLQMADVYKTTGCVVNAINATGWTAGQCKDATHWVPSMWDPQGNQVLPATMPNALDTYVNGINAGGELAGWYRTSGLISHALRWNATGQPAVLADSGNSTAAALDDSGNVVGLDFSGPPQAVVWHEDGTVLRLAFPTGAVNTAATAINAVGTIVGAGVFQASNGTPYTSPVIWKRLVPSRLMPDQTSGIIGADAVNGQGIVVGNDSTPNATQTPYEWKGTTTAQLPGLSGGTGAMAAALNSNLIVGSARDSTGTPFAVKWTFGKVQKLQPVTVMPRSLQDGTLATASAINANGWIAAGYLSNTAPFNRPVVLQPITTPADAE